MFAKQNKFLGSPIALLQKKSEIKKMHSAIKTVIMINILVNNGDHIRYKKSLSLPHLSFEGALNKLGILEYSSNIWYN